MRRMLAGSAILLAVIAGSSFAQGNPPAKKPAPKAATAAAKAITWDDLVGRWDGKSFKLDGTKITLTRQIFTADKKITLQFPDKKPMPARLIAMAGDSVTTEVGPYDSITRPGHKTTTTSTVHVADGKMTGTFHSKFDDGQTLDGKLTAEKKK